MITVSSPVGPGEGPRVFSVGAVFDPPWFWLGQCRSQHCSQGKAGGSSVSAHIRGKPHPADTALQTHPFPSLHLNLLLDQGIILKSTGKMKCRVLVKLLHFDVGEALCACDCLADNAARGK